MENNPRHTFLSQVPASYILYLSVCIIRKEREIGNQSFQVCCWEGEEGSWGVWAAGGSCGCPNCSLCSCCSERFLSFFLMFFLYIGLTPFVILPQPAPLSSLTPVYCSKSKETNSDDPLQVLLDVPLLTRWVTGKITKWLLLGNNIWSDWQLSSSYLDIKA